MKQVSYDTSTVDTVSIPGMLGGAADAPAQDAPPGASVAGELRWSPIAELRESKWNPRKYFPAAKQAQLVESMKREGFWSWNPLMGRPAADGTVELGAGHRRFRAAKLAGIPEVPVIVSELSDDDFLRVLTFDNSNREDPHELDEAAGFRFYMERTGATVAVIAGAVGQSEAYVYQRLKYADLIPTAKKAFWDEKITAGHAILIARLQPPDQTLALKESTQHGGRSVRSLEEWIERHIHRDVKKACFGSADAKLLAGVPACTDCLKRAGNSRELFADIKNPHTCMDPTCYGKKEQAFIQLQIEKRNVDPDPAKAPLIRVSTQPMYYGEKVPSGIIARAAYSLIEKKSDVCDASRDAIVAYGDDKLGRIVRICDDKSCKKHRRGSSSYQRDPQALAHERQRKEKEQQRKAVGIRLRKAIADRCPSPWTQKHVFLIAEALVGRMHHDLQRELVSAWGLEPIERKQSWGGMHKDYEFTVLSHLKTVPIEPLANTIIELSLWAVMSDVKVARFAALFGVDKKLIEKQVASEAAGLKQAKKKSAGAKSKK